MIFSQPTVVSRPFNFYLGFGIPLLIMVCLLVFDPTALDYAVTNLFYSAEGGFVGRHSFFLEKVLHKWAKQAVVSIGALAIAGLVLSGLPTPLRKWRRELCYLVLALGLSTGVVMPLKMLTEVHCPWSLTDYGGSETYTPLLSKRAPPVGSPGLCWPGGHAATGFSLLAFFFVLRDRRPRAARGALIAALVVGGVFSLGRTMQGAHFVSHNLWTFLLDWIICLGAYRMVLYLPGRAIPAGTDTLPPDTAWGQH